MAKIAKGLLFASAAAIQAVLYLAFVSSVNSYELVAAAATGVVSTFAAVVFANAGKLRFRFHVRDIIQVWRLPWYAITGTGEVMHGLLKQLFTRAGAPSFLGAVRFDVGSDAPEDAGRRALVVTYTTATPNSIILEIIHDQHILLYHQIIPGEIHRMTQKLGARP